MKKVNVLLISTYYPPINHIASYRIFSFAKYLDKSKYNVFVLTLDGRIKCEEKDDLEGVKVIRTRYISPFLKIKPTNKLNHKFRVAFNFILHFIFSENSNWARRTFKTAIDLINENGIDILISSFGPVEPHMISVKIKQKFSSIKWIADMRDEMSANIYISKIEKWKLKRKESTIFKYADAIVAVSEPIMNYFANSNKNKCLYKEIKNGFDFEIDDEVTNNPVFCITYAGTFYKNIKPANFFLAVESLLEKKLIDDIRIIIVGSYSNFSVPVAISKYLHEYERSPHEIALKYMKQSDALLLILPANGRSGVYSGKLFEYLGMTRPIIALVDKSDVAAKLITECRAGFIAENENIPEICEIILKAYNNWKNKETLDYNLELIKSLHRREQTKNLESLIDNLFNNAG